MLCMFFNIFPQIFVDIAKPRLQKILLIIFSLDDITSLLQKTKLCALPFIVNCYIHMYTCSQ